MRVTLDLDKLLAQGEITKEEYDKLLRLSARHTTSAALNILMGFGVIAVCLSTLAIFPSAKTAVALGFLIGAGGVAVVRARLAQWLIFAHTCVVIGALLFGGGLLVEGEGSLGTLWFVAGAFAAGGAVAGSALLVVLSVLVLASALGASTGYTPAAYYLGVEEPGRTVILFTLFSIALYQFSKRLPATHRHLAIAAARTGVLLVNLAFWVGSLWGDRDLEGAVLIPDWVFAALWAVALILAGIWAWSRNRRWLLNAVAVFGSIHFYTQWFERLGASTLSLLVAGLIAIGVALWLRHVNAKMEKASAGASPETSASTADKAPAEI